jgi:hypothetical protein
MTITLFMLAILSIVSISILYIVKKLILKQPITLKEVVMPIIISAVISSIYSILLWVLYISYGGFELYAIPIVSIILFFILMFIFYKIKAKLKYISIVLIITLMLNVFYINFGNTVSHKFLVNINKQQAPFIEVNKKIQNRYDVLLLNLSKVRENVSFKVLDKDIQVISPKNIVKLEPEQKVKLVLILESLPKNIRMKPIEIEISNSSTKEIRKSMFIYSND